MDSFETLKWEIPCRERQIRQFANLIREEPCQIPACFFINGLGGTGKSLVVSSVLNALKVHVCRVNCIEFYSPRIVFESLLNQMMGVRLTKNNGFSSTYCDNWSDFVQQAKALTIKDRWALVLEQADRLREASITTFPALCRLQEVCETNITVIFISRISLDKFRCGTGFLEPLQLHYPQYTKAELIEILMRKRLKNILSDDAYKNYINIILSVFYTATRNLPELKHLAELNMKFYLSPIEKGDATENDIRVLYRYIEPRLKKALSSIYLREMSSEQFIKMQEMTDTNSKDQQMKSSINNTKMELPYYSKFLLIAAYLASYNPARTDKRFFMKNHGKKRKTQASIKAQIRSCSQLVGPKAFPLDRLLAIFYSIIEEKVAPTASIFTQVSSLVSLRLLTSIGSDDPIEQPKYKSNVSLEFITYISRTVDFEIMHYLYDYAG